MISISECIINMRFKHVKKHHLLIKSYKVNETIIINIYAIYIIYILLVYSVQ